MEELLADSSDDDDLDDTETSGKGKDKKGAGGKKKASERAAWIHEGGEGIVDLLAKDAAQRIVSTRPGAATTAGGPSEGGARKRKGAGSEFKVGADGRLIITETAGRDSEDDEEEMKPAGKGNRYFKGDRDPSIVT